MTQPTTPAFGEKVVLQKPFDAHVHFRTGDELRTVLPFTARFYSGAIVMPNIGGLGRPHVYGCQEAIRYRDEIQGALDQVGRPEFYFGLTLYLTDSTHPDEILRAFEQGLIVGVKMYPAHGTTNSAEAVTDPRKRADCFRAMADAGIPLLVHGEKVDMENRDSLNWEGDFMTDVLVWILDEFPTLRISVEHISTTLAIDALEYGLKNSGRVIQATLTPQHFTMFQNHLLGGMLRPDLHCKPGLKLLSDLRTVRSAVLDPMGLPIVLGTDSAPHVAYNKYCDCGCAGCFSAPHAIGVYANGFPELHLPGQQKLFKQFSFERALRFYPSAAQEIARRGLDSQTLLLEYVERVPMPRSVQVGLSAHLIHPMPHPFVDKPGWVETYLL